LVKYLNKQFKAYTEEKRGKNKKQNSEKRGEL